MKTGTVQFFNETKGFGFIKEDGTDKDVFVHKSGIVQGAIYENDKVEFDTETGPRGEFAVNVKKAE